MSQNDSKRYRTTRTQALARTLPPARGERILLGISCGVIVLLLGVFTATCAALNVLVPLFVNPGMTVMSGALAIALAVPHLTIILWVDRNEPEPPALLVTAFLWGAVMATGISLIFNTTFGAAAMSLVNNEAIAGQLTASFSAPPIEEMSKGLALLLLYLFFKHEFDNVLDGIIYGAIVGMGFAVFENFVYYVTPFIDGRDNPMDAWVQLVMVRGVITGVGTHWVFTALTGAGLGMFRVARRGLWRWLLPPLGLGLAILMHFSWNTFAGVISAIIGLESELGNMLVSLPIAVLLLQVPFILLIAATATFALRHEAKLIRKYLRDERRSVVYEGEVGRLVPARRRLSTAWGLLLTGQFAQWWRVRRRNRLLVALAFERWHMDQEDVEDGEETAGVHARNVVDIRKKLRKIRLL